MALKANQLGHFGLTVRNLEKSMDFYINKLGFEVHYPPEEVTDDGEGWCMLEQHGVIHRRCGIKTPLGSYIELLEYKTPAAIEPAPAPNNIGAVHISIKVDDIFKLYEELSAEGIHFHSEPLGFPTERGTQYWTMFRDPDGIVIEVMQNPK